MRLTSFSEDMKKLAKVVLTIAMIYSCSKQENPSQIQLNGMYTGFFELENTSYWCSIAFGEGRYEEWPFGGAYNQKSMGCLSFGSFLNNGDKLVFEMDSLKYEGFPDPCESIMLLPGVYNITYHIDSDSIVFEKDAGDKKIVYYLKNTALIPE